MQKDTPSLPDYREDVSSQLPALQLLQALGYTYLTPEEALVLRGGQERRVVLSGVLEPWLKDHNHFTAHDVNQSFSDAAIQEALRRIQDVPLGDGFVVVAQRMYELITLGFSYTQFMNGETFSPSLHYVDWQHPEQNVFHVTEEFAVEREGMHTTYRPDLVCFVNGIPFAIIECKRPDLKTGDNSLPHEEAISQHLRNQKRDGIRPLYVYANILMSVSVNHASYATTDAGKDFWFIWREENQQAHEEQVSLLINSGMPAKAVDKIFDARQRTRQTRLDYERQGVRLPSAQDLAIASLLAPKRLLEISRHYILFDAKVKKIARYQQYFAIQETLNRVLSLNPQGERTGGVIWHTTGSGKSLTMVMLTAMLQRPELVSNARVILVTDRINLDRQITDTFSDCGMNIIQANSGRHLLELVRGDTTSLIATVINKFEMAADEKITDPSPNIFVLVDESHRGQYGLIHSKMRRVFPHACYIGFTGTPLTKKEKSTALKFGSFIHKYNMRQAVADGAVLPLLYEGRMVELKTNQEQLDRWFDRHTADLSEEQKADLKHKMSRASVVNEADHRIQEIAYNLSTHFARNFKDRASGLKAQLATSSKETALRYRKYIRECGLLTCEVVISGPDTREGHEDTESGNTPEVLTFWKDMMSKYGNEKNYNDSLIARFKKPDDIDLLIVVDKLLVGFDEPLNTVLYLDKPLHDHAILQAIARVNRVHAGKQFGYVVDYRGVLGELNAAIETYDELAEFDTEDIAGTIQDVIDIIALLPQHHSDLWAVFKGVNTADMEAMAQYLAPEDVRQRFYEALTTYTGTLKVALSSTAFYEQTSPALIAKYKEDLRKFVQLRQDVKVRYAEAVDFRDYEKKIRKLLDAHIDAGEVRQLTAEVSIFDQSAFDEAVANLGSPRAKAEAILNHLQRTALENMERDPAYYRKFSRMIEDTLQAIAECRLIELDALKKADELREEFFNGQRKDLPGELNKYRDAPAYYGIMEEVVKDRLVKEERAKFAIRMEEIVQRCKITDWQHNPDVQKQMVSQLEDALYDLEKASGIEFTNPELDEITYGVIDVAKRRE